MRDYVEHFPWPAQTAAVLTNVAVALLILVIGLWLARRISHAAQRALMRAKVDLTLVGFLRNLAHGAMVVLLIVAALAQAGVSPAPMVAALGAASLAIGLSLQGSLSNLASGVLLILFRPFGIGDYIQAGGVEGTVESISLMHTKLVMGDNREAVVPNAKVANDAIINFNRRGTRRFELRVRIGYQDDIGKAMAIMEKVCRDETRVLAEPVPAVYTEALADSSVNLLLRANTSTDDYFATQTTVLRRIKERFDAEGISIPFPQHQLHVSSGHSSERHEGCHVDRVDAGRPT